MGNELQKAFTEELTTIQKTYLYINNAYAGTNEGFNVAEQLRLYDVTPNANNIKYYSRLGHFSKNEILATRIGLGEDEFKRLFIEDPEELYKNVVSCQKANRYAAEEARNL